MKAGGRRKARTLHLWLPKEGWQKTAEIWRGHIVDATDNCIKAGYVGQYAPMVVREVLPARPRRDGKKKR